MSEEGAGIANMKEEEVMEMSSHSCSEQLIHSNCWIQVLFSSIWGGGGGSWGEARIQRDGELSCLFMITSVLVT